MRATAMRWPTRARRRRPRPRPPACPRTSPWLAPLSMPSCAPILLSPNVSCRPARGCQAFQCFASAVALATRAWHAAMPITMTDRASSVVHWCQPPIVRPQFWFTTLTASGGAAGVPGGGAAEAVPGGQEAPAHAAGPGHAGAPRRPAVSICGVVMQSAHTTTLVSPCPLV